MNSIHYLRGDATSPAGSDNRIIVHICNDIGGWGKGFVMALSRKWPEPEQQYREWHQSKKHFQLGSVQFVQVEPNLWIANLIGQHNIHHDEQGNPPIRYEEVRTGMQTVRKKALELEASVHMPRIGCGLAGGKWAKIEPILLDELITFGLSTSVYDFD